MIGNETKYKGNDALARNGRQWGGNGIKVVQMKTSVYAALLLTCASITTRAQINAGDLQAQPSLPFTMTQVASFNLPWRIAFLPDGRMIVAEKVGPVWLVTQQGAKTRI